MSRAPVGAKFSPLLLCDLTKELESDHAMLFEITPLVVFPDNFRGQRMFDDDKNMNSRIQSQSESIKCYLK